MLDLYGMSSPNVLKIMLFLEELEIDYRFHPVNVAAGEQFDDRFMALNPMRKVPVIVDQDGLNGKQFTVFESAAILSYLAEKYDRFLPRDDVARYEVIQWLMVEAASAGPLLAQLNHYLRFAKERQYSLDRYRTLSGRAYDMFDARLKDREFIAADEYSIADMALFPWVEHFYEFHGMDWKEHPNLVRWRQALNMRPGVARSLARYRELAAQDLTFSRPPDPETLDMVLGRGKFTRP